MATTEQNAGCVKCGKYCYPTGSKCPVNFMQIIANTDSLKYTSSKTIPFGPNHKIEYNDQSSNDLPIIDAKLEEF